MKTYARFLNYVKVNTKSDPTSNLHPSTEIQMNLGKILVDELLDLGLEDAYMDKYGYVYATLPSNSKKEIAPIGLIAHMDTSPDFSGENVKPRIIFDYSGEDIILNETLNIIMRVKEFPFLHELKGQNLIVTDGTTLLGADDKAGIAEIMGLLDYLVTHPEIEHGIIKICFTPDEEIGEGPMFFNYEYFKVDFAYTVDGGKVGIINYENFNAASAKVNIHGVNIHPGSAKNIMKNSILIAMEFHAMLPHDMRPELTEHYEGFNHLNDIKGEVEKTELHYIIRNHDMKLFQEQKEKFGEIQNTLNQKYGPNTVMVTLKDQYFNMKEIIKDHMHIVEIAKEAIETCQIPASFAPIRGGTDGAQLTYQGLICPNLPTGGFNFHGKYECITIEALEQCTQMLIEIVKIVANK